MFKEPYSFKSDQIKRACFTFPLYLKVECLFIYLIIFFFFARHFKADSKQIKVSVLESCLLYYERVAVRHAVCHRTISGEDL